MIDGSSADLPLAIAPGRDFSCTCWQDEAYAVAFDGNSGDFWIISVTACRVLELLGPTPKPRHAIIEHFRADAGPSFDEMDLAAVIDGLLSQKLIVATSS